MSIFTDYTQPLHRQPSTLQSLALLTLTDYTNTTLVLQTTETCRSIPTNPGKRRHIDNVVRFLQDYIVARIPTNRHDAFFNSLVQCLRDHINVWRVADQINQLTITPCNHCHIGRRFVRAMFARLTQLQHLTFEPHFARQLSPRFITNLAPQLSQLRQLNLQSFALPPRLLDCPQQCHLVRALCSMPHLVHLTVPFIGDNTLRGIAAACRQLRYLNISHAKAVTDDGVQWIVAMPQLRVCIAKFTSITAVGFRQLLLGHGEQLLHLELDYDTRPWIVELLSRRDWSRRHGSYPIVLMDYDNMNDDESPRMKIVMISVNETCDLRPLGDLRQLRMLDVSGGHYRLSGVKEVLRKIGANLLCVCLAGMKAVDWAEVLALCPAVKEVVLCKRGTCEHGVPRDERMHMFAMVMTINEW